MYGGCLGMLLRRAPVLTARAGTDAPSTGIAPGTVWLRGTDARLCCYQYVYLMPRQVLTRCLYYGTPTRQARTDPMLILLIQYYGPMWSYAISGTELGYAATRMTPMLRAPQLRQSPTSPVPRSEITAKNSTRCTALVLACR
eukprot:1115539-Rhodomonas_salina.1